MKVQFIGEPNLDTLAEQLVTIVNNTLDKMVKKQPEASDLGFKLIEAEFTVGFTTEDNEEPQVLTVEHHEGQPEMFKWIVDTAEESSNNNLHESFIDEWTASAAQGHEKQFEEIESVYSDETLTVSVEETEAFGSMAKQVYNHEEGFKVVRILQDGRLIQEYKLTPKETV